MTVTKDHEIELNGYKYQISGAVTGGYLDPFPDQYIIGDPDYASRRDLSSWQIQDIRAGIGVEEMDEKKDWNKCWWTDCIIKFRNHILPPRLATSINIPSWVSPTSFTDASSGWSNEANAYDDNTGTYAESATIAVSSWTEFLELNIASVYCSAIRVWWDDVYDRMTKIDVDAYYGSAWHHIYEGTDITQGAWKSYGFSGGQTITAVRVRFYNGDAVLTDTAFLYEFDFLNSVSGASVGTLKDSANFNSELYFAIEKILFSLNSARTQLDFVSDFSVSITALISSLNSRLYVYLGDSVNYWYMSTAEAVTESDSANANWGFQHDAKLFKCNTSGTVEYSTDPDGAGPTWTSAGAITDIAAQIEGFVVGRDASGAYVPYASTNSIIKAYDSATPQWIDTEARLPNHPIGGKGHAYWNGKLYFTYGLACKEYYPETGAYLDIGLTERDGLPVEYNGEIVKLLGDTGLKGMFAAVDASVTSGNSKSGLYLYDGYGWQCWWVDTSNNGAMHDIIVSSASSGYAVYWDCGSKIYYIDIPRGIENPDKISQSYATSGIFISPWFDAGNPVAAKLAKVLEDFAKGITTTETVALYYRIDHTQTALDLDHSSSYWTLLETLNTAGETGHNEELFVSGAGISFKAIQFRLDFVTPGATAKPDIQSLVLYHKKRTGSEKLRVWHVTVICDNYGLTTAKQKVANLKVAIISTVDVVFSYHPNDDSTESYYVSANCPKFSEQTGREYEANYELQLVES